MHWLAWHWPPREAVPGVPPEAVGWWALRFTPRVALLDDALLLEVASTERLWGGREALQGLLQLHAPTAAQDGAEPGAGDADAAAADAGGTPLPAATPAPDAAATRSADWAAGPTALQALALLRLQCAGLPRPRRVPHDLPLATLTALQPHRAALHHLGCRTWGALRALPRAGVARRFGAAVLAALDQAWGAQPHQLPWITVPEQFALEVELPALAESAQALLWTGQRLLEALQGWLQARHQGVLALELAWRHDLRRIDGVRLPPWQTLELRTAEPVQGMAHLRRLLTERLGQQRLAAPVNRLALRSLQTVPLAQASHSLLPPDPQDATGEPWHQLVERLSARLGADCVQVPALVADHRPERMQRWHPALGAPPAAAPPPAGDPVRHDARAPLWPPWLVRPPQRLVLQGSRPCLHGQPLALRAGPQRMESGWWEAQAPAVEEGAAARDYFVAFNDAAGWVWIYQEVNSDRWFLHGVYG